MQRDWLFLPQFGPGAKPSVKGAGFINLRNIRHVEVVDENTIKLWMGDPQAVTLSGGGAKEFILFLIENSIGTAGTPTPI